MNGGIDSARAATLLAQAMATTFGDMAFVDVSPTQGGRREIDSPVRLAIDVLKPISCRLEIECPASLKARIEETLFQGSGADSSQEDSLLEILNVAAGVFLTAYFGAGADIKLELPEYLFLTEGSEGEVLAEAAVDAEGEPLVALLRSIRYRY